MMADFPALPLWTDAYLADTTHLSDAEHGRYLLLLMHLWRAPRQRFPNNDGWLARKFARDETWVREQLRPLISEFCTNDGNWIAQKRLSREFLYVSANSQAQSVRAKQRWKKEKDVCRRNATRGIAPRGNAPTPTPTPLEKKDTDLFGTTSESSSERILATSTIARAKKNARAGSGREVVLPDWIPQAAWQAYVAMRSETKHPLTPSACKVTLSKLTKFHDAGQDIGAVLDQSTERGWRTVVEVQSYGAPRANGGAPSRSLTLKDIDPEKYGNGESK